ncbi:calcium-binding protein [Pseudomonas fluorescens]|uniref:calcium-binding protein n=1 Tax=Pseudomonas fluorescens TaxID=294 RepID=UPI00123F72AE|nr:calcium-binding protein [Pseudomonas fluorescens]VVP51213.1 hypothetical protein PS898_05342 [Pseudomonas fluorescens]
MSTQSAEMNYPLEDDIKVSDMGIHKNERTPTTMDFTTDIADQSANTKAPHLLRKPGQLKMLDDLYGPFKIGPYTITRRGLDALGATVNGNPLNGYNTHFRTPSRAFINALQFSYPEIEKRMKISAFGDDYLLPTMLFEMSTMRSRQSPPVIRVEPDVTVETGSYHEKLTRILNSTQNLDLRLAYQKKRGGAGLGVLKNYTMIGASVGFQLFGLFMGVRGINDAIKNNDETAIIFNSVGIGTEVASIVTDVAVTKVGQHMISAGNSALRDFAKTRAGLRFARAGGLIGAIFTVPFDIASAVMEFTAAGNTDGKQAMDHYVNGGLNIASAAMTLILASAAMAGFSLAGPLGLAACAIMVLGSQIYGAVRIVDDIDDYIELTVEERWRTGWFSFLPGGVIDIEISRRYMLARAKIETAQELESASREMLDVTHKDIVEAVVNGSYKHEIRPRTRVFEKNFWGLPTSRIVESVEVVGTDDTIDAREGVTASTPGAVLGTPGENKGVIWKISDGKDTIKGVLKKNNYFYYGEGQKDLTGGEKDDVFIFDESQEEITRYVTKNEPSALRGGAGNDTLILDGKQFFSEKGRGFDIDLSVGTLNIHFPDSAPGSSSSQRYPLRATLESIENVQTLTNGVSIVTGTDKANDIKSRGSDRILAGAGDDSIHLLHGGTQASGEAGIDIYHVSLRSGDICITEDGVDDSFIQLGWRTDLIEKMEIRENSLVLTLAFDFHRHRSTVCINDVYKEADGKRILINNKLTFITQDDCYFKADLPEQIEQGNPVVIQADILKPGLPEHTFFLKLDAWYVPLNQNTSLYIQRIAKKVQLFTGASPSAYFGTRIFLDYDSTEMTSAHAVFKMSKTNVEGKFDVSCDFLFYFDKCLLHILGAGFYPATTLDAALKKAKDKVSIHGYMLLFRDGKSFTPHLDEASVEAKFKHQVYALTDTLHNLELTRTIKSDVNFNLPESLPPKLDQVSACVNMPLSSAQTSVDNLEGMGGTYLVHVNVGRVMRLSTPGGMATAETRLNNSSTWFLDTTKHWYSRIELVNNQLYLGSTTIFLPEYGADDLIDEIFVITSRGIIHTVDLSFDRIYINSLDARFFEPLDPSGTFMPEDFAPIANKELKVRNIQMSDGTAGNLLYSLANRKWILDSDRTREINYSQLRVTGQCSHLNPDMFKITLPDN